MLGLPPSASHGAPDTSHISIDGAGAVAEMGAVDRGAEGSVVVEVQRTHTALEKLQQKITEQIRIEQEARDDNVAEYFKLAHSANRHQAFRIRQVFEKKNQKSAQTITHLHKKLEHYRKKLKELQQHGLGQQHKDVLVDMQQGLKDVGANVRAGISGFGGGVVEGVKGGVSELTHTAVVSKPKEFSSLICNKFDSTDTIEDTVEGHSDDAPLSGSFTLASSPKYGSDDECSSDGSDDECSSDGSDNECSSDGSDDECSSDGSDNECSSDGSDNECSSDGSDDECSSDGSDNECSSDGSDNECSSDGSDDECSSDGSDDECSSDGSDDECSGAGGQGGMLGLGPARLDGHHHHSSWDNQPVGLQEIKASQAHMEDAIEDMQSQLQSDYSYMNQCLQEERYRYERLEEQLNDLTELHQKEMSNLKHELASMEEKVAYQSDEITRDSQEAVESCLTRITKLELQQQQQVVQLEGVENANARALLGKLINIILAVMAVVLVFVSTPANFITPLIKTQDRGAATILLALFLFILWKHWDFLVLWLLPG